MTTGTTRMMVDDEFRLVFAPGTSTDYAEFRRIDHPDNESGTEENQKKLKYPKSVFFIISNEFCERFSFYGMRTVLTLYLTQQLQYHKNTATAIYHAFTMLAYFFPLFGAILADSLLGKFRTIFYLSIIYAIGQILLALTAAPPIGLPSREFSIFGLVLIALGTGGIKPCVSAFGGDQFILPQQERYLSTFFSIFYFSINFGSLISSFLTPVLRSNVECFGNSTCYSLAFLVPAVLMTLSIVIFLLGRPMYRIIKPKGNVIVQVTKCISHAIYVKTTSKSKREHWLDHADDRYEKSMISDVKAALQVMKLFIPIPIFWALFDQQGSRWTLQASQMNGEIGSWVLEPDQMQVINPLLVLAFIPLFETCLYPLLAKVGLRTPLKKLTIGGLLAALSFVVSAVVEIQLEPTYPVLPSQGVGQVRIFNTLNCPVDLTIQGSPHHLDTMSMWVDKNITVTGKKELSYSADFSKCGDKFDAPTAKGNIFAVEQNATSWVITPQGISYSYSDSVTKSNLGLPLLRVVGSTDSKVTVYIRRDENLALNTTITNETKSVEKLKELKPGTYGVWIDNDQVVKELPLKLGGVYTLLSHSFPGDRAVKLITVTEPNSVHMLLLIPQYLLLTMGEVMFSVTGLEFAFTQAPSSMKSLLQASWQMTVAVGNLIVVIIAEASWFDRQMYEFLLFAALMFIDIIVFAVMARFYKYVEEPEAQSIAEEIRLDDKYGTLNPTYKDDEKQS
ncbi:peptide transporter family 1 isoform X2 [Nomia melanderi]|uniref:peptide transporter family 1 isoform X2 n=1 Tax=Nomia melanderi TaxID=2448451 RepID=UPI0013046245|nr:peptide transporter family 1-like isoform X2 [Nomia melanderi]